MTSFRDLDKFRKILVLILVVSTVLSVGAYALWGREKGIEYQGNFFTVRNERYERIFSGKVGGEPVTFTAAYTSDTVTYQKGTQTPITYTVKRDPSAVTSQGFHPKIEVWEGETLVFNGWSYGGFAYVNEEEKPQDPSPLVRQVIELSDEPDWTFRGNAQVFAYGLLFTLLALVLIFFAEALFQLNLAFQIKDAWRAEPSDWELFSRGFGQVMLTLCAVGFHIAVWFA